MVWDEKMIFIFETNFGEYKIYCLKFVRFGYDLCIEVGLISIIFEGFYAKCIWSFRGCKF